MKFLSRIFRRRRLTSANARSINDVRATLGHVPPADLATAVTPPEKPADAARSVRAVGVRKEGIARATTTKKPGTKKTRTKAATKKKTATKASTKAATKKSAAKRAPKKR